MEYRRLSTDGRRSRTPECRPRPASVSPHSHSSAPLSPQLGSGAKRPPAPLPLYAAGGQLQQPPPVPQQQQQQQQQRAGGRPQLFAAAAFRRPGAPAPQGRREAPGSTPNGGATPQHGSMPQFSGEAPGGAVGKGSAASGSASAASPRSALTPTRLSEDSQSAASSARTSDRQASPLMPRAGCWADVPRRGSSTQHSGGARTPSESAPGETTIHVICRFRPVNDMERVASATPAMMHDSMSVAYGPADASGACSTVHLEDSKGERRHSFTFDRVFAPSAKQHQVYEYCAAPLVRNLFQGINGTVFAYGQTGAGKTHTMMGPPVDGFPVFDQRIVDSPERGLVPRAAAAIFRGIEQAAPTMQFSVKVSYVEIYMEKVRDLLNPSARNLQVHDDPRGGGVYLGGATERYVNSVGEVLSLLEKGTAQRVIASTKMNEESNRAHSIFILSMEQRHRESLEYKQSRLFMVDLAGSEKVSKTHAEGLQLDEANKINQSLLYLGMVIKTLTEAQRDGRQPRHVPYLNSKLTRLLQDSLGGNAFTCIVLNCSEAPYNVDESLSSLRFGERAKFIRNRPRVNNALSMPELKRRLEDAVRERERLATIIAGFEETQQRGSDPNCPNVLKLRDTIFDLEQKLAVELREKEVIIQDNRELFLKLHAVEEGAEASRKCKTRLADAESQLAQLKEKNSVLRGEVDRLRVENARLAFDLSETRHAAEGGGGLTAVQRQLGDILGELRQTGHAAGQGAAQSPGQLRGLQAVADRQQGQLLAQQRQLAASREEAAALAQQVELITSGLTRAQRAHQEGAAAAEERIQQLTQSVDDLAGQLQSADAAAAELQRQAAELRRQLSDERQRADAADAEVRQLQQMVAVFLNGRHRDEPSARREDGLRSPVASSEVDAAGRRPDAPPARDLDGSALRRPEDCRSPAAAEGATPGSPRQVSPPAVPRAAEAPPLPAAAVALATPGTPLQRSPWALMPARPPRSDAGRSPDRPPCEAA